MDWDMIMAYAELSRISQFGKKILWLDFGFGGVQLSE